jgi:hypothetical protein
MMKRYRRKERTRDGLEERKRRNSHGRGSGCDPWLATVGTAYLRFKSVGLCTEDLSDIAALKKTNASLLASVRGEASCQNSHGKGSSGIFKGDKREVQQDKINRESF